VDSCCHPRFTTTNRSYRFPIFETSATALCGTTGIYIYRHCRIWFQCLHFWKNAICNMFSTFFQHWRLKSKYINMDIIYGSHWLGNLGLVVSWNMFTGLMEICISFDTNQPKCKRDMQGCRVSKFCYNWNNCGNTWEIAEWCSVSKSVIDLGNQFFGRLWFHVAIPKIRFQIFKDPLYSYLLMVTMWFVLNWTLFIPLESTW
jgi:hypothetical protein